ncbi:MAG: hypothetical protein ACKOA9_08985 [Actinomycetota bacterium]
MRGRWAQGLEPRGFTWVIKDRLAASERPGGFSRNHRKVRRQEELIWLSGSGFTRVLSLLDSPHNLHAYGEAGIRYEHVPLGRRETWPAQLRQTYSLLAAWMSDPEERVLVHHEEFGERLLGVLAGYLMYAFPEVFTSGPEAAVAVEQITGRQLGAAGRAIVQVSVDEGLVGRA